LPCFLPSVQLALQKTGRSHKWGKQKGGGVKQRLPIRKQSFGFGNTGRTDDGPVAYNRNSSERAGEAAGFDMKIHPHMLRHACGFKLANDGVDTRTIQA
jgi:integrase